MQAIDQAAEREEHHRQAALARWRERQSAIGVSAFECADCGEPIPQARREIVVGCETCIECQAERERHAKA